MSAATHIHSIAHLLDQLYALGVRSADVLLVHASFRAVRPLENGPLGLIEALSRSLGPAGTLVMPSWTGDDEAPFNPATTPAAADLGVTADCFWRLPGVRRSSHPFAFAARGPRAAEIVADGLALPPHQSASPVGRVHEADGRILLLGVDHDANTTLHLAELLAAVPYRRPKHITVLRDGEACRIAYFENDHCCQRFRLAGDWLRDAGLQKDGAVGHAQATLMRARDLVEIVLARLGEDPFVFLHPPESGCAECLDAWRGIGA